MAISTDIVLGVSRAADAERQRAAAARLQSLSGQPAGTAETAASAAAESVTTTGSTTQGGEADTATAWDAVVRKAIADAGEARVPFAPEIGGDQAASATGHKKDAYVQFEALLVQNMIEAMMPDDLESVFGAGTAGKVWKSMLAEQVAMEIARTGTIGIAKQIADGEAALKAARDPSGGAKA